MMKKTTFLKKSINNEKGSVLVLMAAVMVGILGITALVTDIGAVLLERRRLQNACDAAALAAARELPSHHIAEQTALEYLGYNNASSDEASIIVDYSGTKVTVELSRNINHVFARILGIHESQVSARSSAVFGSISGTSGIVPFGIPDQTLTYGSEYQLKAGSHDDYGPGNYGPLALEFTGAKSYENNLKYGYDGIVSIGDWIMTEPGNMSGPTESGVQFRINECNHFPKCSVESYHHDCPRVMIVPIFDPTSLEGRDEVKIVGFASFLLKDAYDSGNESIVSGYFLEMVPPDGLKYTIDPNQSDYGLHATRLVE